MDAGLYRWQVARHHGARAKQQGRRSKQNGTHNVATVAMLQVDIAIYSQPISR